MLISFLLSCLPERRLHIEQKNQPRPFAGSWLALFETFWRFMLTHSALVLSSAHPVSSARPPLCGEVAVSKTEIIKPSARAAHYDPNPLVGSRQTEYRKTRKKLSTLFRLTLHKRN
jgi:hypothetical protein